MKCLVHPNQLRTLGIAAIFALCLSNILLVQSVVGQSLDTKWLVLKNGQTLEGKIEIAGDRYTVVASSGSRIVVAESNVNFVADSIQDIYWEKWSRVDPSDSRSHMSLFRWCLKNGLLKEAQKQIDLVSKLSNMTDQVNQLSTMAQELELVVTRMEDEARLARKQEIESLNIRMLPTIAPPAKAGFAAAPTIPSTPIDAEGQPIRKLAAARSPQRRHISGAQKIELVDFEETVPTDSQMTEPTVRDKPAWISNRQLDRETRMLPDGTVSFYKRHLESKLISNCIQCHDSRSVAMPLSKRSFGQTIPRRMSQQNLHFVMEQIDRSNPLSSSLIRMATTGHGKQDTASFKPNDPFMFDLKKWAVAVSDDPARWLMALSNESKSSPMQNSFQEQVTEPVIVTATPTTKTEEVSPPATMPGVDGEEVTAESEDVDVDPYDPAEFNRK